MANDDETVREAARRWLAELRQYIIPGTTDEGERSGFEYEADELEAALKRETEGD